jgi:sugar phosphate isomerase/epimerase
MTPTPLQSIRVGTLVNGNDKTADYIRQILPHGFESFSITFWQTCLACDLDRLADQVLQVLDGTGVVISSLALFGNPLESEPKDLESLESWKRLIDAAPRFGCDIVAGFSGRIRNQPVDKSIPRFREVFTDLTDRAGSQGVRIAFENCQMGGSWATGDWNIAHGPDAWELMFDAVPAPNLGLEWEPCHQMVGLVDPLPQLRTWMKRVFHMHGKDATILWDVVRTHGIYGSKPFAFHRTPGFGDTDWKDVFSELRRGGFQGSIDIEGWHDPVYVGELEMTGQVYGLNYLKHCRGDAFIPNPVV